MQEGPGVNAAVEDKGAFVSTDFDCAVVLSFIYPHTMIVLMTGSLIIYRFRYIAIKYLDRKRI